VNVRQANQRKEADAVLPEETIVLFTGKKKVEFPVEVAIVFDNQKPTDAEILKGA
jgi:hypothetical protein